MKRIKTIDLTELMGKKQYRFLLLFFAVFFILWLFLKSEWGWVQGLVQAFIASSFYMAIIYINDAMLFPRLEKSNRFLKYSFQLLLVAILLTPMKSLLFYLSIRVFDQDMPLSLTHNWQDHLDFLWENFLSLAMVGFISTIVIIFSGWFQRQRTFTELEKQSVKSELKFLKTQINPHFLFNTLNNLYALTLKKSDDAPEVVVKLSNMMRYMLYECNEPRVPLSREIEYLRNYIDLESLRQDQDVDIKFTVDGDPEDAQVAPLLLVPFLENAFKHGLKDNLSQGYLHIDLVLTDTVLKYQVENSKPNKLPSQGQSTRRAGGIGLKNLKRRLELVYPDRHQMDLEESPEWYRGTLNIMIKNK